MPNDNPFDLVRAFERCSNYPKETEGVTALAVALEKSAMQFQVGMKAIVDRCVELSEYCPTDHDLFVVAGELRKEIQRAEDSKRNQVAEWRKQCGPPQEFDWLQLDWNRINATIKRRQELWAKLHSRFKVKDGKWPSWVELAQAAHELGYGDYASAWDPSRWK